ncbi:winged helix-turn-helix domain-containing protein [Dokdonella koreensis]|uniref:Transcriptional regulator domain protein n=1 Tax=Dokdonella koreensis DS-123 TaxID=1300342 RepID=A0A167GTA1_9GAMM|nr:winged helix-turn-helix domain-containing protein [Dokdonella koreensis]ANB17526.1 Transcriptional regulator domain protein [Dokdonella koreensis DS-123]
MTRPCYRFATFELDSAARELRRDGELVVVSPKIFDCLVWLIEHRDRAVGRDELIAAVWGRADVADAQLGQLMRKLRRVIGDDGDSQTIIRTVPRFGYRWIAATTVSDSRAKPALPEPPAAGPVQAAVPPEPPEPIPEFRPATPARRAGLAAAALALLVLLLAGGWWLGRPAPPAVAGSAAQRPGPDEAVAILPLEVGAGIDNEWAWLRLGLMDLVANHLRRAGLVVVPSANVVALARNDGAAVLEAQRVREATGAGSLIAGAAERSATGWVVRLQWRRGDTVLREAEGRDGDAAGAARQAGDRLLGWLQRQAPAPLPAADGPPALWLQRIDAAVLDRDFAAARHLVENAPAELRDSSELLLRQADLDITTERNDAALAAYGELLRRFPDRESDPVMRARALMGISGPLAQQGDLAGAQRQLTDAIAILQDLNQPDLLGEALAGRATLRMVQGDYDHADSDFSQGRVALELGGDTLRLARLEGQQANLLALRNRHAEALAVWDRVATRFERFGDAKNLVDALGNASVERLALLESAEALATAERALPWLARIEDGALTRVIFDYTYARVLIRNGRDRQARALLEPILDAPAHDPVLGLPLAVRTELARLELAHGNAVRAARLLDDDAALIEPALATPLYARLRASGWLMRVRTLRAAGRATEAQAEVRRFTTLAERSGEPDMRIHSLLAVAEQDAAAGRQETAAPVYEAALREANRAGSPADVAEVVVSYGDALIAAGDHVRASAVVGQVARWAAHDFDCALLQARLYQAVGQAEAQAAALARAQGLAGERPVPAAMAVRRP